ncbi:hypothetical protein HPB50_012634 [Hyalomma asiaticum]|uniref:Uncharacterized protein n=1 Tax=Hyalomma asiaticum TaxID=266040 RepID=A0ACB7S8V1_HYAAI|nr:hypothetical protein HPB50_012634 [Hyalomma asiaticum]
MLGGVPILGPHRSKSPASLTKAVWARRLDQHGALGRAIRLAKIIAFAILLMLNAGRFSMNGPFQMLHYLGFAYMLNGSFMILHGLMGDMDFTRTYLATYYGVGGLMFLVSGIMSVSNTAGQHLLSMSIGYPPWTMVYDEDGVKKIYGYVGAALTNITASMNITAEIVAPLDGHYGGFTDNGTMIGSLMMIDKGFVDVAAGPFDVEYSLWKEFPSTKQLFSDDMKILSGMRDPFVSDSGAFINMFDRTVRFVPLANRVLLGAWLLACFVLVNLFNGEVKANLLVKSDTLRINTVDDLLRHPDMLPIVAEKSPLAYVLQTSSLKSVQDLYARSVERKGHLPVMQMYTPRTLDLVVQRRAAMMLDTTSARVHASKQCSVLRGYFYIGTQNIWLLRSSWYFRRDIPRWIVTEFDKRVLWLSAMPSPFMRDEEVYPHGTPCFLDSNKQDRSSAYQPLRFEDLRAVFILSGYILATSAFFLLVEFVVYGVMCCCELP